MNNKGFTLIELLVVVLILGILAAMAMPQYFKAVERSRMSEAVTMLSNLSQSQRRKYLQINKFATDYRGLDVAPKGATGSAYCTKGTVSGTGAAATCGDGNGFAVAIAGTTSATGKATAKRVGPGTLQYNYTLERYYDDDNTTCSATEDNGKALCADFCGIDTPVASCCSDGRNTACTAAAAPSNP